MRGSPLLMVFAALPVALVPPPWPERPHPVTLRRARLDRQRAHACGRGRR